MTAQTQTGYRKPIPQPSPDSRPYWEATKRHELQVPFCNGCQRLFWYPRVQCPRCHSWDIAWRQVSGRGKLHTYAIQHRPQQPGFENDVPYITALVELDEDASVRIFGNLINIEPEPERVKVGMPVEVVFEDITEEITLPKWQPAQ